ncbi:MAG: helix-turn-helix protein [Alphaproteobacteria bacterium ADurb.Bin438]|nr:MAG: helix-turn-helix protein [Alphaproteobacteria bacterium ADurb.Bin438]
MNENDLKTQIGQKMREVIKEKGISQEKAAKMLGLESQTRLFHYLSGRSCMDYDNLLNFCKVFKVSLNELFGIDKSKDLSQNKNEIILTILRLSFEIDKVAKNVTLEDKALLISECFDDENCPFKSDFEQHKNEITKLANIFMKGKVSNE